MKKELKISAESALAAYNNTDADGRELLEHLFGKEIFAQDIKDKIKTFDDAVEFLGNNNKAVIDYHTIVDMTYGEDVLAFAKLRVIAEALNDGWKPKLENEHRYYTWFHLFTEAEYMKLNEDVKKDCYIVDRSIYNTIENGGVIYVYVYGASTTTCMRFGSRLTFKTEELAKYCGKQFIDIWERFLFA